MCIRDSIRVAYNGYSTSIEEGILQTILNRGGMSSMLQYVAIICFAVGMGGMLDRLGVLGNLLNAIVNHINSDGSLIAASLLVGYVTSLISCSQPMSHVLTGNMMKPLFKSRKIAPEILSRTLEDAGTLSGPMIPWHGYCVYTVSYTHLLDLAHRAQYLVPRLSRCQARQTISRRKLQIHTHPVRQKAHSLNQLRICPRNCFHMDVTVKSMDAPKAVQGLIQQFHRVIRCLQHTGT